MSYKNFKLSEFDCRHCGANEMQHHVIDNLQRMRDMCNFPFIISSGYRCKDHPIEAAKLTPGPHNTGWAVDIVCSHKQAISILVAGFDVEFFTGFGIAQRGDIDTRFIHLDACEAAPNRPRPHLFSY